MRHVSMGDYVKEGSALFEVTDLTHVWIMFDAYESDLPWINPGDEVIYTVQSIQGKSFQGRVIFIDPLIDPSTRVARVRVEQNNTSLALKPEMFANGMIQSNFAESHYKILIPKSSVLWTGKRSVVYIKVPDRNQASYIYREIELGPESGSFYVVSEGLSEGEEIAVNGVFKIDAAAQLAGKPSMMNPEGGKVSMAHDHGSMSSGIESKFKEQLQAVYKSYIPMKDAFIASDPKEVSKKAQEVMSDLQKVDMNLLAGNIHMEWMKQLEKLRDEINLIANYDDVDRQRVSFAKFNDVFYTSLKTFGLHDGTVYYQYCPMANGDKGAFWMSTFKEIKNPYFGDAMLSCGETRETLEF